MDHSDCILFAFGFALIMPLSVAVPLFLFSFIVVGPFDITFSAASGPVGKKPVASD